MRRLERPTLGSKGCPSRMNASVDWLADRPGHLRSRSMVVMFICLLVGWLVVVDVVSLLASISRKGLAH